MRKAVIILSCALTIAAHGQWEVPVPVVLGGATTEDRQVTGLAHPVAPDAGMSVAAVRGLAVSFTEVSGTEVMAGTLSPAPPAYTPGMLVTIVPTAGHHAGAQLDLNGLGPVPIIKGTGVPLDSADLVVGVPARLLYNGEAFVVVSHVPRRCPAGFVALSGQTCMEETAREPADLLTAAATCAAIGGRLCRFAEWIAACNQLPGFEAAITEGELVDSAANHADRVKTMGVGSNSLNDEGTGCGFGAYALVSDPRPYRCCLSR